MFCLIVQICANTVSQVNSSRSTSSIYLSCEKQNMIWDATLVYTSDSDLMI